jgi:6-phosphogluconolactonase
MSFSGAARAALVCKERVLGLSAIIAAMLLGAFLLSCGGNKPVPNFSQRQNAYVTLPSQGSVLLMQINPITGSMITLSQTPQIVGTSPKGLALLNKFLYVANSAANNISLFNIASDGSLSQNTAPTPAGSGPYACVIDPSNKYLLVTNTFSNNISVFSIDSGSGALTEVSGSPFYANLGPGEIFMPPAGNLVYVTSTSVGTVTGFTFSPSTGALTQIPGSPYYSGTGASGLAVDSTGTFLYVANTSAINNPPTSIGNITGYNISQAQDSSYGSLTPITGSPFTSIAGSGPMALVLSSNGTFLFATTPGGSYSVWAFNIGQNGALTATINSPFSVSSGGLFALIDSLGGWFYIGSNTGIQGYTYDQNTGQPTVINYSPFSTGGVAPGKMVIVPQ